LLDVILFRAVAVAALPSDSREAVGSRWTLQSRNLASAVFRWIPQLTNAFSYTQLRWPEAVFRIGQGFHRGRPSTQRRSATFGHTQIVLVLVFERPARPRTSGKILHKMREFQG
jgi:hypothetical protein